MPCFPFVVLEIGLESGTLLNGLNRVFEAKCSGVGTSDFLGASFFNSKIIY